MELESARSIYFTGILLDLEDAWNIARFTLTWKDCVMDRTPGVLLRANQYRDGAWLRALDWKETNVVYAGPGAFFLDRQRRQMDSEAEWNEALRLATNSHRLTDRRVFPERLARSAQRLNAADLDLEGLSEPGGGRPGFNPVFVGEGEPYEKFRREADYRQWQKQVRATVQEWQKRRAPKP